MYRVTYRTPDSCRVAVRCDDGAIAEWDNRESAEKMAAIIRAKSEYPEEVRVDDVNLERAQDVARWAQHVIAAINRGHFRNALACASNLHDCLTELRDRLEQQYGNPGPRYDPS